MTALQEPHIDFLGHARANSHWTVIYSKQHLADPSKTRAIIPINRNMSTNWNEIPFKLAASTDVTGVRIHGEFGAIYLLNINNPNDCGKNSNINRSIDSDVVKELMSSTAGMTRSLRRDRAREKIIWMRDFNLHHPLWDEEWNGCTSISVQVYASENGTDSSDSKSDVNRQA